MGIVTVSVFTDRVVHDGNVTISDFTDCVV
jgi:hypothetical protein